MANEKPIVLITNDDGINSPALDILREELQDFAEVWIVAPDRERSAISHAISISATMATNEIEARKVSVSGTPADCVWLAHRKILPRTPDLVISGINSGHNLGSDILYSGTVQAAAEGVMMGSIALAVSAEYKPQGCNFRPPAAFAAALARRVLSIKLSFPLLLNINVPYTAPGEPQPEKFALTRLGQRRYKTSVHTLTDARKREYYWAEGTIDGYLDIAGSDCATVEHGIISVTPLQLDMTGYNFFAELTSKLTLEQYASLPYEGDTNLLPPFTFNGVR